MWVTNDRKGFAVILNWIGGKPIERLAKGLPISKVNPRLARRFAEASGRLAKTDCFDAQMLAVYGQLLQPRLLKAQMPVLLDLKELHVAGLALIKDRTSAKNPAQSLRQPLRLSYGQCKTTNSGRHCAGPINMPDNIQTGHRSRSPAL